MIDASFFTKNKNVLVVGAGRSGMAALRLLAGKDCQLAISDGGPLKNLSIEDQQWLDDHKVFQEFDGHTVEMFLSAECIVVSPGVPLEMEEIIAATEKGIPVIGELELGALYTNKDIIAVTGTNGKTTVTTLIGELLEADGKEVFVGGNIGTPLCEYVTSSQTADVLVLEVSSFQLDTIVSFHPHIALLLNISPDHLDRYESYDAYADSKMKIFNRQKRDDYAVINGEDSEIKKRLTMIPSTIREFGRTKSSHARLIGNTAVVMLPQGSEEEYKLPKELAVLPNGDNCLAAITAARLMGCTPEGIQHGLEGFHSLAHRLTEVTNIDGVVYIDDSKATNVGAVKSALSGIDKPVHLIAGGRDKGGDYQLLGQEIRTKVKNLILIGEAADIIAKEFDGDVAITRAASMNDAVVQASCLAESGDVVLLSPACASFDMFASYVERGNVFQKAVKKLSKEKKSGRAQVGSGDAPLLKAV